jgi:hypothetical protein
LPSEPIATLNAAPPEMFDSVTPTGMVSVTVVPPAVGPELGVGTAQAGSVIPTTIAPPTTAAVTVQMVERGLR